MEILSLVKLNKGKYKICLDNGTDFTLYWSELKRFDLEEGKEVSDSVYGEIMREVLIPRCKKRGMHLLEKQDKSESNLRQKLREGGYPPEAIDAAIEYIESFGYIDDERMAKSYIRFYQDSRSRGRIKNDLMAKGISSEIIENALDEEYAGDEMELINTLLQKKNYDRENSSLQERAKMFRFLAGRGFSMDSINKALRD